MNALARAEHLCATSKNTVSAHVHTNGIRRDEPLIVMMDCLYQYAIAYEKRFDDKLSKDPILGDEWLIAIKAIHALLDGDGVRAMEDGITTDSKDNGTIEAMYWDAIEAAGFTQSDLDTPA